MAGQFRKSGERQLRAEVGTKVCVKFAHTGEKATEVGFFFFFGDNVYLSS